MLSLMKSGYWKILWLFYSDRNAKIHLREIARRSGLHGPSVSRYLSGLEKDQILQSEKDANLKKYSLRKSSMAYLALECFDIDKFERLPSIRRKAIRTYLDTLTQKPVFAVLFGSTAKETYREDSDIDVLLVTNGKISTKEAEKEADAMTGMRISTFKTSYEDFILELRMRDDKLVHSAIRSGYPLLNHIRYYEALFDEGL